VIDHSAFVNDRGQPLAKISAATYEVTVMHATLSPLDHDDMSTPS
jgi:hypothetical protein